MTEQQNDTADNAQPDRLIIGRITAPHGIRGEFRMYVYSHFPENILEVPEIYIGDEESPRQLTRARRKDNLVIMRVEGVTSKEMADELRDELVRIDFEHAAPLEEGEYYHFELIGLTAFDESGNELGTVEDIIETGANDVYVIKDSEGKEILIPALEDVVPEIDVDNGRMVVRPLPYAGEE